jgi:hypothetical protein
VHVIATRAVHTPNKREKTMHRTRLSWKVIYGADIKHNDNQHTAAAHSKSGSQLTAPAKKMKEERMKRM